jgi:hypothetical protein
MKKICSIGLLVLLLVLAGTTVAKADSVTVGDIQFTGTVTSTLVTLTIQCLDSACADDFLGNVSLKGFTDLTFVGTGAGTQAGYTAHSGGQNNGVNNDCNNTQPTTAVCWSTTIPLTTQLGNGILTFTADITGGVPPSAGNFLHVQAVGYNNDMADQTMGGKVFAVSQDLNGSIITAPEPAAFTMLGIGLLGLMGFARRRLLNS